MTLSSGELLYCLGNPQSRRRKRESFEKLVFFFAYKEINFEINFVLGLNPRPLDYLASLILTYYRSIFQ